MADNETLKAFLEKEFGDPSDSKIMKAIAALTEESKAIQASRERMEQGFQMQLKQRTGMIDRQYQAKMAALKTMGEKMKSGSMTKDDILNLKVAIDELLQLLELKKEKELETAKCTLEERNQSMTNDFEEKSEQKMQEHLDSLSKIEEELGILENCYEAAPFDAPIWANLCNKSKFPQVNNIRLGEKQIAINCGDKPRVFTVPQIVPFFVKKSLLITYDSNQRDHLKDLLDSIMVRCLMSAEAGNILFYLLDGDGNGSLFFDYLRHCSRKTLEEVFNGSIKIVPADIERVLVELQLKYQEIDQKERKGIPVEMYNKLNPKSPIPYRIVVMDHFPMGISSEYLRMITQMMKYETDAGLHFVFLVDNKDAALVTEIMESPNVCHVSLDETELVSFDSSLLVKTLQCIDQMIDKDNAMRFEEYYEENVKEIWTENSTKEISIPLGSIKANNFDLHYNNQFINTIISGGTGCGKSSLLHSMIMGACLKYSPDELRFILIDAKAVEFRLYAEADLPHADVVALKADPQFGLHVLGLVEKEIEKRKALFGSVSSIEDYRKLHPEAKVPRYLVLIDEYQYLITGDLGREVVGKLERILSVCRAFGIHVILSSQDVHLWDGALNNIQNRMAMKSALAIARTTLGVPDNRAEGIVRGQFIYRGGGSLNMDVVTSYFLPKFPEDKNPSALTIQTYLDRIQDKWLDGFKEHNMMVFDQETHALLNKNKSILQLKPGSYDEILFSPGEKFMVDGTDFVCKVTNEKDQNLLVIGGKPDVSVRTLNGIIMSMMPQFDHNMKMDILNLAKPEENRQRMMALANASNIRYSEDELVLDAWLDEIVSDMEGRKEASAPRFLVVYCTDNCECLKKKVAYDEIYKRPVQSKSATTGKLLRILQNGPQVGIHCLLHFTYTDIYPEIFEISQSGGDKVLFSHRVLLQMDAKAGAHFLDDYNGKPAQDLVDTRLSEEFQNNFALYFNKFDKQSEKVKPYAYYDKDVDNY